MSAPVLVSEEDVLAALVLNGVVPLLKPDEVSDFLVAVNTSRWPRYVAEESGVRALAAHFDPARAIAESERRLEVERSQVEVIRAAYLLAAAPGSAQAALQKAVYRMNRARSAARMETLP